MKQTKRLLIGLFLLMIGLAHTANAQEWSTRKARKWAKQGEWANGFQPMPHRTTNYKVFAEQYHKNKSVWDKTFKWLATHDLAQMPAGRYPVDGDHVYINVEDAITQEASKRKIEGHRHTIDLQYVVTGTERFGLTSAKHAKPITEYKPDVTFYESTRMKYVDSTPNCFFIFFPGDYHQALLRTGKTGEKIRVIVAKIEYID
ncbi:MAG: YhcH/YjgK/YiaL family protein [Bacteroides sp.]